MATVYKLITGNATGNQVLVLDPRERLVYPFNIPSYQEIRVGMFFSFTSITGGNNSVISDDAISTYNPTTRMVWGVSDASTGSQSLPGQTGSFDFWGMASSTYAGLTNNNGSFSNLNNDGGNYRSFMSMYDGTGALFIDQSVGNLQLSTPNSLSGYAGYFGLRFILGANSTYQGSMSYSTPSVGGLYVDTSTSNLRNILLSPPNASSSVNGYWTSGRALGAPPMGAPNGLFIYNPMINSKMRIHNLLVEKYA